LKEELLQLGSRHTPPIATALVTLHGLSQIIAIDKDFSDILKGGS